MTLTTEQLAELLAGVARSQQAIIDAIESESGGWRNTHLLPKLNTAANTRLVTPRLIDIPSRILLRSQGRVPMDVATIVRTLEEAAAGAISPPTTLPTMGAPQAAPLAAVAAVAAVTAAGGATDGQFGNFFDN